MLAIADFFGSAGASPLARERGRVRVSSGNWRWRGGRGPLTLILSPNQGERRTRDGARGYGAFSVSPSQLEAVLRYVDTQQEHHSTRTFQEEYRELLHKHGIDFDERYVWD